jgi:hypothetical protein
LGLAKFSRRLAPQADRRDVGALDLTGGSNRTAELRATLEQARELSTAAKSHAKAGEHAEAVDKFRESVALQRTLLPDAPSTDGTIALALWNLSMSLRAIGQSREALSAAQEATLMLRRRIANGDPPVSLLNAMVLYEITCGTVAHGTDEAVVEAGLAAAQALREHTGGSDAKRQALVVCLEAAANSLSKLDRNPESLALRHEVAALRAEE